MLKNEIKALLTAFLTYSRLRFFTINNITSDIMASSVKYLPYVGLVVGIFSYLVYYIAHFAFSNQTSIIFSMICSIMLTGAFHEDGFADVCDGFGGGWNKEQILRIMKDSSVGAFGAIGLIIILLLKFSLLNDINLNIFAVTIISAHTISRFSPIIIVLFFDYSESQNGASKSRFANRSITFMSSIISIIPAISVSFLYGRLIYLTTILPIIIIPFILGLYFRKKIGGYRGDCLGAVQQISEIVFYMSVITIQKLF